MTKKSTILIVIGVAILAGTIAGYVTERFISDGEQVVLVVGFAVGASVLTLGILQRQEWE